MDILGALRSTTATGYSTLTMAEPQHDFDIDFNVVADSFDAISTQYGRMRNTTLAEQLQQLSVTQTDAINAL
jgi:hypothetical protein